MGPISNACDWQVFQALFMFNQYHNKKKEQIALAHSGNLGEYSQPIILFIIYEWAQ